MRPTERNIFSLRLGEHRDPTVPGFLVRITPSKRHFEIRYTFQGQQCRLALGNASLEPIADARETARQLLAGVRRGIDPREAVGRRAGLLVADLGRQFFDWAIETKRYRKKTLLERQRIWKSDIEPHFGSSQVEHVDRVRIRSWGETLLQRSGYAANRPFELLRCVLRWALDRELIKSTPFGPQLKRPFAHEKSRERFLSSDELAALLQTLNELPCGLSDALLLLLLTGLRRSGVLGAHRSEFDTDPWIVPSERMKSDRPHEVPLSRQGLVVVARQRARLEGLDTPFMFPDRSLDKSIEMFGGRFLRKVRTRMEHILGRSVERWTPHDLKRTVGTQLEEQLQVRLEVVSKILSHAIGSEQTRIYARAKLLAERREALQRWADWLETLKPLQTERMLSAREAASALGLEIRTLATYRGQGRGPAARMIDGRAFYRESEIEAALQIKKPRCGAEFTRKGRVAACSNLPAPGSDRCWRHAGSRTFAQDLPTTISSKSERPHDSPVDTA